MLDAVILRRCRSTGQAERLGSGLRSPVRGLVLTDRATLEPGPATKRRLRVCLIASFVGLPLQDRRSDDDVQKRSLTPIVTYAEQSTNDWNRRQHRHPS